MLLCMFWIDFFNTMNSLFLLVAFSIDSVLHLCDVVKVCVSQLEFVQWDLLLYELWQSNLF